MSLGGKIFVSVIVAVATAMSVFAATFTDVSPDDWYFEYVEKLVEKEILDVGDSFRPNDPLNRAELVKMAIVAIDGLLDYEPPAYPTFKDVPEDEWYYQYVESALQLGIVSGYTDAEGNQTFFFGPGDNVTRAQAAKIIKETYALPTLTSPHSSFADVPPTEWFHDYVVSLYNWGVVDGYKHDEFGPSDFVTRAQIAKMIVLADKPPIIN